MDVTSLCLRGFIIIIIFKATENTSTSYQLIFNPTEMSWIGASTWCQLKGGTLVTIDSQSVVLMIEWYKNNDWNTHWSSAVWAGLYSYNSGTGYWQGTCKSLDYTYWAATETFISTSPCMYMASSDLFWHYDSCTNLHYVVCQTQSGNCSFDDQNMKIDNSFSSLADIPANTLDDCKTSCDSYIDGDIQCWAIMYQAAAQKCYMYVSVNPAQYVSTTSNKNNNFFYSTRDCFQASILQENEPPSSSNIETEIEACIITTTDVETTEVHITPISYTGSSSDSTSSNAIFNMGSSDSTLSTAIIDTGSPSDATSSTFAFNTESSSDSTSSNSIFNMGSSDSTSSKAIIDTGSPSDAMSSTFAFNTESSSDSTFSTAIFKTESTGDSTSVQARESESTLPLTTLSTSVTAITSKPTASSTEIIYYSTSSVNTTATCSYQCPCGFASGNVTAEMLQERLSELRSILQIDKTETSSYIRKRTSAEDNRTSAQAVGSVGALFIVFIMGFIVCTDFISLFRYIRNIDWKRIKELISIKR